MSHTNSIAAVEFLAPCTPIDGLQPAAAVGGAAGTGGTGGAASTSMDFAAMVSRGVDSVQQDWAAAESSMTALAEGQPVNLHQVMMRMEESRLSFQLFMQVRNRLLESYQDVMRMQV